MTQEEKNNLKRFYNIPHHFDAEHINDYRRDISICINNHSGDEYDTVIIYHNGNRYWFLTDKGNVIGRDFTFLNFPE